MYCREAAAGTYGRGLLLVGCSFGGLVEFWWGSCTAGQLVSSPAICESSCGCSAKKRAAQQHQYVSGLVSNSWSIGQQVCREQLWPCCRVAGGETLCRAAGAVLSDWMLERTAAEW
jgi:hypothetical protein